MDFCRTLFRDSETFRCNFRYGAFGLAAFAGLAIIGLIYCLAKKNDDDAKLCLIAFVICTILAVIFYLLSEHAYLFY